MYNIYVCNNCINNDECLSKSSKNKAFKQHGHAGKLNQKACWPPSLQYFFFCKESSIIIHLMLYIYSKIHMYINI